MDTGFLHSQTVCLLVRYKAQSCMYNLVYTNKTNFLDVFIII